MARRKKLKEIRIGVFGLQRGLGFVKHMQKIKGVKLVAVCEAVDTHIEKAKEFLPEDCKVFKNFDEFIDCGMDAVVLANYFHEHAKYAIKALEKKIHVLSETTAAPTLGECVQLCRAVEQSKCKYMLAANTSWMPGPKELRKLYAAGEIGKVRYAQAEYLHPTEALPGGFKVREKSAYTHWRRHTPRTYYNMHSMGALMEITGAMPVRVTGAAVFAPDYMESVTHPYVGDMAGYCFAEMDNGALFNATGCAATGPVSKWFRLSGDKGNIETVRLEDGGVRQVRVDYMKYAIPDGDETKASRVYTPEDARDFGCFTKEELEYAKVGEGSASGHAGNCDFFINLYFIKYLRGEVEPFFNVYRACALSAAAILSWRSILNNGQAYDIPDFTDRRRRRKYEKDFLSPFPDENGEKTVSSSSKEYDLFKKYGID